MGGGRDKVFVEPSRPVRGGQEARSQQKWGERRVGVGLYIYSSFLLMARAGHAVWAKTSLSHDWRAAMMFAKSVIVGYQLPMLIERPTAQYVLCFRMQ